MKNQYIVKRISELEVGDVVRERPSREASWLHLAVTLIEPTQPGWFRVTFEDGWSATMKGTGKYQVLQ